MDAIFRIYIISCLYIFVDAAIPSKSVNLAVETSFLIEPEDTRQNITVLRNVRRFLEQLEGILKPIGVVKPINALKTTSLAKSELPSYRDDPKSGVMTTFLSKLGAVVIHYDEEDVKSLATALRDEVTKIYLSNQSFQEMLTNVKMQAFLLNSVTEWASTDPLKLKVEISKYITNTEITGDVMFFRNINQFFVADNDVFEKLLIKYIKAKNTKKFGKALRKTLMFIIKRYSELDDARKAKFRNELDDLTKFAAENYKHRLSTPHLDLRRTDTKNLSESVSEDFRKWENSIEDHADKEIRIANNIQVSVHKEIAVNSTSDSL